MHLSLLQSFIRPQQKETVEALLQCEHSHRARKNGRERKENVPAVASNEWHDGLTTRQLATQ